MKKNVLILLSIAILSCRQAGNPESVQNTASPQEFTQEQRAALELGYYMGSKIVRVALPQSLRQISYASIEYSNDEMKKIFLNLKMPENLSTGMNNLIDQAFLETDPIEGGSKLLEILNALRNSIIESFPPGASQSQMWRVFRIGVSMGFLLEEASIISSQNPTQGNFDLYTGITQQWRVTIPEDLELSSLPDHLKNLIRETNIEVNNVDDLTKVIAKTKELYLGIRSEANS